MILDDFGLGIFLDSSKKRLFEEKAVLNRKQLVTLEFRQALDTQLNAARIFSWIGCNSHATHDVKTASHMRCEAKTKACRGKLQVFWLVWWNDGVSWVLRLHLGDAWWGRLESRKHLALQRQPGQRRTRGFWELQNEIVFKGRNFLLWRVQIVKQQDIRWLG